MTQRSTLSRLRRFALGVGLCLLAVLFALEAKFAWYGPATGPLTSIQSAKARPADLPELVSHGAAARLAAPLQFALIYIPTLEAAASAMANSFCRLDLASKRQSLFTATYFSPGLFFRPPPVLRIL